METALWVFVVVIFVGTLLVITVTAGKERALITDKSATFMSMATHKGGHPGTLIGQFGVLIVDQSGILFTKKPGETPFFSIPYTGIKAVNVSDHQQVVQRLTVTRMLAFGVFSLAAPKKTTTGEKYLVIECQDSVVVFSTGKNPVTVANSIISRKG